MEGEAVKRAEMVVIVDREIAGEDGSVRAAVQRAGNLLFERDIVDLSLAARFERAGRSMLAIAAALRAKVKP